jgi:hypothetical protein
MNMAKIRRRSIYQAVGVIDSYNIYNIYNMYTPSLGFEIAVSIREREKKAALEGATREYGVAKAEQMDERDVRAREQNLVSFNQEKIT